MRVRRNYSTDLTEKQWRIVEKLLPKHQKGRKPIDRRQVINALFYLIRTGCPWRHLPRDFPKWKTVDTVFWRGRNAGVWEKIHDALCRFVRKTQGKKPTPSVGILDSQSEETTEVGGKERGYDAGKKVKGRKRRILVDTLGYLVLQAKNSDGGRCSCGKHSG
ncbi:MAG: IS5 family transposase [Planctomycetaceae bacterium]|jgi:transposase|nr:IS5 family transposase [Planctomycetaceae bacterium]